MICYEVGYTAYHTTTVLLTLSVAPLFVLTPIYVSALVLIVAVCLHLRCSRVRVRSGCSFGKAPCTEAEILSLFRENPTPTPVGSGWNAYLQRQAPPRPVHLHLFCNDTPLFKMYEGVRSEHWWRAGTTLGTVAAYYKTKNKAFGSLPSVESITLGSWVWSGSHGSSGSTGIPSNAAFGYVRFLTRTRGIQTVPYKDFQKDEALVILYISFDLKKLVSNIWLHKRAISIDHEAPSQGVAEWLQPSFQRAIFVGKRIIGLQWSKSKIGTEEEHRDPHCCSRFCLWIQADPCNAVCGCCWEPLHKYASQVQLYEVNRFVPPVWRLSIFAIAGCGHYNCEIFCRVPLTIEPLDFFTKLTKRCYDAHAENGGRTELRYTGKVVFVDIAMQRGFDNIFKILEQLGVDRYALHEGKLQWVADTKMVQVLPATIYQARSEKKVTTNLKF